MPVITHFKGAIDIEAEERDAWSPPNFNHHRVIAESTQ